MTNRRQLSFQLMAEAEVYAETKKCSLGRALCKVAKENSGTWEEYCAFAEEGPGQPKDAPSVMFMTELKAFQDENKCSCSDALIELSRRRPDLKLAYDQWVMGLM